MVEHAIKFGRGIQSDWKKMNEEYKRLGRPKYFEYNSVTGKGRAVSEEEHQRTEELCRLQRRIAEKKEDMRRKKAIEKKLKRKKA